VCESYGNRYNFCPARVGDKKVYLERQLSDDSCVRGSSWGVDRNRDGIWVDRGCRGKFRVEHRDGGCYDRPKRYMTCESYGNKYNHCPAQITEGVRLRRNLSDTDCVRGRNWGHDSRGVWVDNGCRGEFEINFR
jgi:hypothetical protein